MDPDRVGTLVLEDDCSVYTRFPIYMDPDRVGTWMSFAIASLVHGFQFIWIPTESGQPGP